MVHPPDKQVAAVKTVLEQAEVLCADWETDRGVNCDISNTTDASWTAPDCFWGQAGWLCQRLGWRMGWVGGRLGW